MIMAQERKKERNEGTRAGVRAFGRFVVSGAHYSLLYIPEKVYRRV